MKLVALLVALVVLVGCNPVTAPPDARSDASAAHFADYPTNLHGDTNGPPGANTTNALRSTVGGGDIDVILLSPSDGGAWGAVNLVANDAGTVLTTAFGSGVTYVYTQNLPDAESPKLQLSAGLPAHAPVGKNGAWIEFSAQDGDGTTTNGGDVIIKMGGNGGGDAGANGNLVINNPTTANTVGSSGSAAALPTPVGYLHVKIGGSVYAIPYFNP